MTNNSDILSREYYSKLLLFGEYSVMYNGEALAVPFKKYSFKVGNKEELISEKLYAKLHLFYDFIKAELYEYFDVEKIKLFLAQQIYFESSIPISYGLGSSGAVSAFFMENFLYTHVKEKIKGNLFKLMQFVAQVESFFHGKSSGIDPLVIYLGEPVYCKSKTEITPININWKNHFEHFDIYLYDTKLQGETAPLVKAFQNRLKDKAFQNSFKHSYLPILKSTINDFVSGNSVNFLQSIRKITDWQLAHLTNMIPKNLHAKWKELSNSGKGFFKLCGSGGGGYMLLIAPTSSKEYLENTFEKKKLERINEYLI